MDVIPMGRMIKAAEAERGTAHEAAVGLFRVWFDHTSQFILIWLVGALFIPLGMGLAEWLLDPASTTKYVEQIGALIATALGAPLIIWFVTRRPRYYAFVRFGADLAQVHASWSAKRPVVEWLERPVAATFRPRPRGMAQRVIIDDVILFTRGRDTFASAKAVLGPCRETAASLPSHRTLS